MSKSKRTVWIMEDEETSLEWFERLTEARADVDKKYPREKGVQVDFLASKGLTWFSDHWLKVHLELDISERDLLISDHFGPF